MASLFSNEPTSEWRLHPWAVKSWSMLDGRSPKRRKWRRWRGRLAIRWSGLPATASRADFHIAPLVWEYAKAAGYATAYDAPGWGVELDEKAAAEFPPVRHGHERWTARVRRPDGAVEAP